MVVFSKRVLERLLANPPYEMDWWMVFYTEALNRPGLLACLDDELLIPLRILNDKGFVYVQKSRGFKQ